MVLPGDEAVWASRAVWNRHTGRRLRASGAHLHRCLQISGLVGSHLCIFMWCMYRKGDKAGRYAGHLPDVWQSTTGDL